MIPRLDLLGILLQLFGHRLYHLQQSQRLPRVGAIDGNDDAHQQALISGLFRLCIRLLQSRLAQRLLGRGLGRRRRP